jgi:hypothetical protein
VTHPIVEQKSIVGGQNYFWRPRHRRRRPRDQVCENECMTQIIDIFERYDHQMACLFCSHVHKGGPGRARIPKKKKKN